MDVAPGLNYGPVGIARLDSIVPDGMRGFERSIDLGVGDELWKRATAVVSGWAIKKRVGFRVAPDDLPVVEGRDYDLRFGIGKVRLPEPARVVWIADEPDVRGFGYGTRPRHPVTGEEAFLVRRDADGRIRMIVRSVSQVSRGRWRLLGPAIRIAQPWFQRRYLRAAVALSSQDRPAGASTLDG